MYGWDNRGRREWYTQLLLAALAVIGSQPSLCSSTNRLIVRDRVQSSAESYKAGQRMRQPILSRLLR